MLPSPHGVIAQQTGVWTQFGCNVGQSIGCYVWELFLAFLISIKKMSGQVITTMRKVNSTKMYGSVQVKSNISLTVVLDEVWGHFHHLCCAAGDWGSHIRDPMFTRQKTEPL
jgi:hypothetical protein